MSYTKCNKNDEPHAKKPKLDLTPVKGTTENEPTVINAPKTTTPIKETSEDSKKSNAICVKKDIKVHSWAPSYLQNIGQPRKLAPLTIEGSNLGERHRSFNKLVKEPITNQRDFDFNLQEDDDLQNLLKIEVAAAHRHVEFILEVLKGEDMLYVSRALNRTTWLITDNQYAHIINPEFLFNELLPHMMLRAFNKLLLNIRLYLRDETRVECFYKYFNGRDHNAAFKWLQHCSVPFIADEVRKYNNEIPTYITKKIFKKSFKIYETSSSVYPYVTRLAEDTISTNTFALQNTEPFLNLLEESKYISYYNFGPNITKHFMNNYPERIVNKIDVYYYCIHFGTFIKCIKDKQNLIDILIHKAKKDDGYNFFVKENLEHWKELLPEANRFDLIKKYFIDEENIEKEENELVYLCKTRDNYPVTIYNLYKHAPFSVAFTEIKPLIRTASGSETINAMLEVILSTIGNNSTNIREFLQYYLERHINETFKFKKALLNTFLAQTEPHTFDDESWSILNKLFHSLEVYINSENSVQTCVETIIVRNAIHGVDIPDIVQSKFKFNTMKSYENKLKDQKQKDALFNYLYKYLNKDIEHMQITNEKDFIRLLGTLTQILELLKDWKRDIQDYPIILEKIKRFIVIKNQNTYKTDLSSLYETNKTWRKALFEESMSLMPSDKVCVNAIKHDIDVFERHRSEILNNDKVTLKQTLMKIRVYWPDTMSQEIKALYAEKVKNATNFEALVTGICILYSERELKSFFEAHAPTNEKFDWSESDDKIIHLRKHIAMNMYKARPLVPVDFIIMYAKGDYLQYTIPSISAMSKQRSRSNGKQLVTKLLDAPVSLQKFGIRYAVQKLDIEDLTTICSKVWKSTKNFTTRMVLFTRLRTRICQEQDETVMKRIWEVMTMCIDGLTGDENKNLYKKLSDLKNIPLSVKPEYYMKVYKCLSTLSLKHTDKFKTLVDEMKKYFRDSSDTLMDLMDDDFLIDYMLTDYISEIHRVDYDCKRKHIFLSFMLHKKDEDSQIRRFEKFLAPFLDTFITSWGKEAVHGDTTLKNRIQSMLANLTRSFFANVVERNMNIPYKLFQKIYLHLENGLNYEQNYVLITYWKVVAEFVRLISKNKDILQPSEESTTDNKLNALHKMIAPEFGKFCAETLREDVNRFYPSIYLLFTKCLSSFFDDFVSLLRYNTDIVLNYHKCILEGGKEVELHMAIIPLIDFKLNSVFGNEKGISKDIRRLLYEHSSSSLKLHYYNLFPYDPKEYGAC